MKRARRSAGMVAAMAMALASAGCGSEGGASLPAPVPPAAEAGADAISEASIQDSASPSPDGAVAVRRTVTIRDPFGNYAETGNLLLDGDFEWAGGFSLQYPWFKRSAMGIMTAPEIALGPACKSGMKCANVPVYGGIGGIAVRPAANAAHATLSLWLKPASGDACTIATVSISGCNFDVGESVLDSSSASKDAEGWCHVTGQVTMPDDAPCVFVTVHELAKGTVLVDDVVMTSGSAPASEPLARVELPASHMRIVAGLREAARDRLRPRPPTQPQPPAGLRGKVR